MTEHEEEMGQMIDALFKSNGDVPTLDNRELISEYSYLSGRLLEMGEVTERRTPEGERIHLRRDLIQAELLQRKLM